MNSAYKSVEDAAILAEQAKGLKTTAVQTITDVEAERIDNKALMQYISDLKFGWIVPLSNGDILFNNESKAAAYNALMKLLPQLKKALNGKPARLRPAAVSVIEFLSGELQSNESTDRRRRKRTANLEVKGEDTRSPVQRRLDTLVAAAREKGVTDIHIETDKESNRAVIKFRNDGDLIVQQSGFLIWKETEAREMGAMIIDHEAQMGSGTAKESFDENKPNDGSFEVTVDGLTTKLRYSHQPQSSPRGLSIVMRLVTGDGEGKIPGFEDLGYERDEIALLQRAFRFPHGVVLFTGPTGSGKSSAMAAGIITLPSTLKILSYEDPVEVNLPNVVQVQVGSQKETSFAGYARTALRQDPDVIIYGEIRDTEVAEYSGHQANTGHLVISTLHTNSAPEAIPRLADLGFEWNELGGPSLVRAITAQRLVRKLCQHCAVPLHTIGTSGWSNEDLVRVKDHFEEMHPESFASIKTINRSANNQCTHCGGSGEKGRLPIAEIILLDERGRHFIKERDLEGWIKYLKGQGWESMSDKATRRVLRGELCPVSVERVLESPYGIRSDAFDYGEFKSKVEKLQKARLEMTRAAQARLSREGA
ncbi:GspE/PulE family protein [Marinimicrobium sp. ABcell2]|uniref:GspE/PulE family protein n=1 Tax=Marinimicrobium sp. ABcell2 TaxID=3069751 RepID=UPI0027B3AAFE|nr:ATPase, T2SS/T4P/T4SS family [Marinimicrobium sp. ABcell2]MDQ2077386.1 ATPase, T2SS/T4P/T4SS family [Marinimicrobium sp. ABcell2]